MNFKNSNRWQQYSAEASSLSSYTRGILEFAERWANLIEVAMAHGDALEDVALKLADQANEDGITANQFDAAVEILVECWTYGDKLLVWNNSRIQLHGEAAKANAEGALLRESSLIRE